MNLARNSLFRLLIAVVILAVAGGTLFAQDVTKVRFVHAVPETPAVDVYVNGALAVNSLAYGESTGYINVPAGEHSLTVTAAGLQVPLAEQQINATAGSTTTFVASNPDEIAFQAFSDTLGATTFGSTRLLLVHAIADAPPVDVVLAESVDLNGSVQDAGTVLASEMSYGSSFGSFDVPAQTYIVDVVPSGTTDAIASSVALPLNSGTSYFAIVAGTAASPEILLIGAPTNPLADAGQVRFVHGAIGGPNVDVYVNDTLVIPGFADGTATAHIAFPTGDHALQINEAGTENELLSSSLTVESGSAQTVVALAGADGTLSANIVSDDVSGVTETTAVATVFNAIADSQSIDVTLEDGTSLASALAAGEATSSATVTPSNQGGVMDVTLESQSGAINVPEIAFYGGTYYNLIAVSGDAFNPPRLIVAETSLSTGLSSAPDAGRTIATTAPEVDTTAPEEEPEAIATTAPAEPTSAPEFADSDALIGRIINLDPGVNLHLRQYPSPEALSLGLAPVGSTLEVLGREGAPVALVEGEDPPPEAEEWVDPVEALGEDDDLNPEETWLNVIYPTPDGGTITAWVIAQYVDVRDDRNVRVPLRDLETIGSNIPGEAVDTDITPPAVREDRVTVVITDLNPGVNLNIRRLPDTVSEVLVRLPNNTVTEFVGLVEPNEDGEQNWVFVEYITPEGGSVTGWASTTYVRYEYNARETDMVEIRERGYYNEVNPETIGVVRGSVQAPNAPTPDPMVDAYVAEVQLDPGANLQFRRLPDEQSESLNLIPSGTRLIVDARTQDATWLKTTFEGEEGWVSSQFVVISFNGQFVEVTDVPVDTSIETEPETESAG